MLQECHGSHFPQCCRVPLAIPFGCQILFQNIIPSVSFSIWETVKSQEAMSGEQGG
jgi:hypothetical protein